MKKLVFLCSLLILVWPSHAKLTPHKEQRSQISILKKRLKKQPENIRVRENLGQQYLIEKKYDYTIKTLSAYIDELSSKGLSTLSKAYDYRGYYPQQIKVLKRLVEKTSDRFRPHYLLAVAYENNKQFNEAIKEYKASIKYAPKHKPSYDRLLNIYKNQKNSYEARIILKDMRKTLGDRAEILSLLCKTNYKDAFLQDSLSTCKKAIQLEPKNPDNHVYLAQTYLDLQKTSAAKRVFINAARQFKKSEHVQWAVGEFYFTSQNYSAAARYLRRAVRLTPKSARSNLGLALSLYEIKEYKEALEAFIRACKNDKTKSSYNALRASITKLRQAGKYKWSDKYYAKEYLCR